LVLILPIAVQAQTPAGGEYVEKLSQIITKATALVDAAAHSPTGLQRIDLSGRAIELDKAVLNLRGEVLQAEERRLTTSVLSGQRLVPNKALLLTRLGCDLVTVTTSALLGWLDTQDRVFLVVARDAKEVLLVIRKGL